MTDVINLMRSRHDEKVLTTNNNSNSGNSNDNKSSNGIGDTSMQIIIIVSVLAGQVVDVSMNV